MRWKPYVLVTLLVAGGCPGRDCSDPEDLEKCQAQKTSRQCTNEDSLEWDLCDGPKEALHCSETCDYLFDQSYAEREACAAGSFCSQGRCRLVPTVSEGGACASDDACLDEMRCSQGLCWRRCHGEPRRGDPICPDGYSCGQNWVCVPACVPWEPPEQSCPAAAEWRAECVLNPKGPEAGMCAWGREPPPSPLDCFFSGDCAAGFMCRQPSCRRMCDPEHPCPELACVPFEGKTYGLCAAERGALCGEEDPCLPAFQCVGKRCRSACTADDGCSAGEACVEGMCLQKCIRFEDPFCPPGDVCRTTGAGGFCAGLDDSRGACTSIHQCRADAVCKGGQCTR